MEGEDAKKPSPWTHLYLQKLTDMPLHSHLDTKPEENGDIHRAVGLPSGRLLNSLGSRFILGLSNNLFCFAISASF